MNRSVPLTHPRMHRVPKRSSLLGETLSVLRDGMRMGRWIDCFPGERELAEQLQVSRPTVRTALRILQKDGWVQISHGRRTRIQGRRSELPTRVNRKLVALLCPDNLNQIRPATLLRIDGLRGRFHDVGVDFQVYIRPRCFSAHPERMLQSIVREVRAGCWILQRTNRAVQQWFASNRVPCMMTGMTYDGVPIPCIDTNQYALSHHAVGLFRNRGHSRIGFLLRESGSAGDEDAVAGFSAAWREEEFKTGRPLVMRHEGSLDQIRRTIKSVSFRGYNPTALLVGDAMAYLAVVTLLQRAGKRIPEDVALICRAWDMFFDYMTPSVACYSCSETVMGHTIFQTTMEILRGESPGKRKKLLIPEFVPGESLG